MAVYIAPCWNIAAQHVHRIFPWLFPNPYEMELNIRYRLDMFEMAALADCIFSLQGFYLTLVPMLQNHGQYIVLLCSTCKWQLTNCEWRCSGVNFVDVNLHEVFLYALNACYTVGSCKLHDAFSLQWWQTYFMIWLVHRMKDRPYISSKTS
jgi:hypothetical protein